MTVIDKIHKRRRTDWDAVERDYRTGKLTLREMAVLHKVSHQAISMKAAKQGWTQDLRKAIKQATNAVLIGELVSSGIAKNCQTVANTVLAAAELNKQVILGHRTRLTDLALAVDQAKGMLLEQGKTVISIREAATFVQGVANLAGATKTLIEQERQAFNIDDDEGAGDDTPREFVVHYRRPDAAED